MALTTRTPLSARRARTSALELLATLDGSDDGSSFKYVFADGPAESTLSVSATDDDGGDGSDSQDVSVENVAPSATFDDDGPVNEGESFTLSPSDPSDPSAADADAGFEYNMKVQLPLNTTYTVVIHPFGGTSGPRLAHVIQATK
jgi:hypothetical protein